MPVVRSIGSSLTTLCDNAEAKTNVLLCGCDMVDTGVICAVCQKSNLRQKKTKVFLE